MKKLLLAITTLLFLQTVLGQEWKISVGPESKSLKYSRTATCKSTDYIGTLDNTTYLVGYDGALFNNPYLASYDDNLVELHKTSLPNGNGQTIYGGFANPESIDLLTTNKVDNNYKTFRLRYNPSTLEQEGEPKELASFISINNIYTFVSRSQSNEWTAILYAEVADNYTEWRINMYDTELDELWNMELTLGAVRDWLVTDSADLITAGFYRDQNDKETQLFFNIIDGEQDHSFVIEETLDDIQTMQVVRYANGKIYCTGLIAGEKQDYSGSWSSGFYSLAFDTRSGKMTHYEKIDFSKENIADLCNVAHRFRMKILSTDRLSFCNAQADKDGTTVLFERSYNLYLNQLFTYTDYVGMLLYRIDNNGRISWYKTIPREIKAPLGIENGIRTRLIPAGDSKYSVFYMDSPGNVNPKPNRPAKITALNNNRLVLLGLSVDKQGNISRQGFKVPNKSACVFSPKRLPSGDYMLILSQPLKACKTLLRYE